MAPLGLRPLPYRKVARRLAEFGFVPIGQSGSHVRFAHPDGRSTVVPFHARDDLDRWLLMKIVKAARLDPEDFFAAFR